MNIISNDGSNKLNRSRKARVSYKVQRTINASLNAATSTRAVSSNPNFEIGRAVQQECRDRKSGSAGMPRSEERFSRNAETDLVCRLLLEKKKRPDRVLRGAEDRDALDSSGLESAHADQQDRRVRALDPSRVVGRSDGLDARRRIGHAGRHDSDQHGVDLTAAQQFFFYCSGDRRDLPSFPTRRSSDLGRAVQQEC